MSTFEDTFIQTFNERCQTHKIGRLSTENTEGVTSRYIHHLPDFMIIRPNKSGIPISFAVSEQPIEEDNFFNQIKMEYQSRKRSDDPLLIEKDQIFPVPKDDLNRYKEIANLGVAVIIIGWQKRTNRFIAQYADKIVICHQWYRIFNTHIDSYEPLDAFCGTEFGIEYDVLEPILNLKAPDKEHLED